MFKNQSGQVRAGWLILLAGIAMFLVQTIFTIPGIILLVMTEAANMVNTSTSDVMATLDEHPWITLFIQGGGTAGGILITLLLWRFVNKMSLKELGIRGSGKDFGFGLLLGAISITIIFILLMMTGNVELINGFSRPEFTAYTLAFAIMFILVGFFEEMFFRGYVISTMLSRGNKKWVIYVVSALLFSIVHATNPNVSMIGLINIALVGILFAYMFDVTNSLWLPIGYHMTWNYFQGNVFGFAVSGTTPHGIYNVSTAVGNKLWTGGAFGLEGGLMATILILAGFIATNLYAKRKGDIQEDRMLKG
ncbi:membrane protease YdiL (CAAX protease family) [Virgibacillus halotolerans]|uniref:CPBP family intramembrane glutamic endopeptidase n=1 Tax=Virgibacillus halotolerans TaxID=1071053 RepID=UPI001961512C|nr:CPBP family intramembrane glutamic endopeptidase [Virgibacillus halotolerans]MBM7600336.1 membrane protease YdiL (CAAX protease family) [Virgibacillus halotolerans]